MTKANASIGDHPGAVPEPAERQEGRLEGEPVGGVVAVTDVDADADGDVRAAAEELRLMSEAQRREAEEYAWTFLNKVLRLKVVRIDRTHFLTSELHRRGVSDEIITTAVADSPAGAGISLDQLDEIALSTIRFETQKSTALSFAAGLPGGIAMVGAIPADVTQFYVHAFRVMQKVAYLYGWQSFLDDVEDVDDETLGRFAAFLGVMMGVGGASGLVIGFTSNVARPALQKQIASRTLTKTSWYLPLKRVLGVVGVKVTKDVFARGVAKVVPVVGGVVSGGMTMVALRTQSKRLMRYLRELPPPNVDAEAYLAVVRATEPQPADRAGVMSAVTTMVFGVSDRLRPASRRRGATVDGGSAAGPSGLTEVSEHTAGAGGAAVSSRSAD